MGATDENVNTWGPVRDVTFQWTIIAEGQRPHSMGWLSGASSDRVSIHHCLFADNDVARRILADGVIKNVDAADDDSVITQCLSVQSYFFEARDSYASHGLGPGSLYFEYNFTFGKESISFKTNVTDGFWSAGKYHEFHSTFRYTDAKVVLDKYTIVEQDRMRTVYNWLQYFSSGDLEREFANAGFSAVELYSDVAGTPFDSQSMEFAAVATKG